MTVCFTLILLTGLAGAPAKVSPAGAPAKAEPSSAECYGCHGDKSFGRKVAGGRKIPLYVDKKQLKGSVHGDLGCESCHPTIKSDNHTEGEKRGQVDAVYKACKGCHEPGKTVHGHMVSLAGSPRCSTCHGKHDIRRLKETKPGCQHCHGRALTKRLTSGDSLSLRVDAKLLARTAHGKVSCVSCHPGFTNRVHALIAGGDRRARHRTMDVRCQTCHSKIVALLKDSVHAHLPADKLQRRPGCTDCHTAHTATGHKASRRQSAARCQQCHTKVYEQYARSVHGAAMLQSSNPDVPACANCHRAHSIRNPGAPGFRARIPELCGNCHADPVRMSRYKLSPDVVRSYLDDFHGVTLQFYRREKRSVRKIATCVDCHGIHDIASTRGVHSKLIKQRLLTRCRKCHPKASTAFPDAWVSHWIPSAARTPLVFWILWFYRILIPLMLIGLGLQVGLHFWRYAVKR